MQDVAEAGACIAQPQPEPRVAEQPRVAVADGPAAPRPADVGKDGPADPGQAKWVPIGEKALLDGDERPRRPRFIAQREAAQAVVPAEQELHVRIQRVRDRGRHGGVQQPILRQRQ